MNIIIHRGTHQIGGSAIEISTASTRIILDFGNELSLDEKYTPINLDIDGVTKGLPDCDGIVISHYHMDHLGQLTSTLPEIPFFSWNVLTAALVPAPKIPSTFPTSIPLFSRAICTAMIHAELFFEVNSDQFFCLIVVR